MHVKRFSQESTSTNHSQDVIILKPRIYQQSIQSQVYLERDKIDLFATTKHCNQQQGVKKVFSFNFVTYFD